MNPHRSSRLARPVGILLGICLAGASLPTLHAQQAGEILPPGESAERLPALIHYPSRTAFIAGNSEYATPVWNLPKSAADAKAMHGLFTGEGLEFQCPEPILDASRDLFLRAFEKFLGTIHGSYHTTTLLYFSGHGFEHRGDIRLMTSNASRFDPASIEQESVSLTALLRRVQERRPSLIIAVLDCCRNAPEGTPTQLDRAGSTGLRRRSAGRIGQTDILIAYASGPGQVATSGADDLALSPYTHWLIENIRRAAASQTPLSLEHILKRTRRDVYIATDRMQRPWYESSLLKELYFPPPPPTSETWGPSIWLDYAWTMRETFARMTNATPYTGARFTPGYERRRWQTFRDAFELEPPGGTDPRLREARSTHARLRREAGERIETVSGPASATPSDSPWVSLPSPDGAAVQLGRLEVTVGEFRAFAEATQPLPEPVFPLDPRAGRAETGRSWRDPGFPQAADHPVVGVSRSTARAYCRWLSSSDPEADYRLPTDREWSLAAGLVHEPPHPAARCPAPLLDLYPWGQIWPPLPGSGNFAGEERRDIHPHLRGYRDAHRATSPVGSFDPCAHGYFDLGGNVAEWVEEEVPFLRGLARGASWRSGPDEVHISHRHILDAERAYDHVGFRVVRTPAPQPD